MYFYLSLIIVLSIGFSPFTEAAQWRINSRQAIAYKCCKKQECSKNYDEVKEVEGFSISEDRMHFECLRLGFFMVPGKNGTQITSVNSEVFEKIAGDIAKKNPVNSKLVFIDCDDALLQFSVYTTHLNERYADLSQHRYLNEREIKNKVALLCTQYQRGLRDFDRFKKGQKCPEPDKVLTSVKFYCGTSS